MVCWVNKINRKKESQPISLVFWECVTIVLAVPGKSPSLTSLIVAAVRINK